MNVAAPQLSTHQSVACWILAGLTVFAPLIDGGTTHVPVLIIRLMLLGACSVWLYGCLKRGTLAVYATPVHPFMTMFIAWAALSICWSPYANASLQWVMTLLMYMVFCVMVVQTVRSVREVRSLVVVLLGMGIIEGGIGLTQYLWLGELRARGTFFNPNFFATYEAVVIVVAASLPLFTTLCWKEKLLVGGAALIGALAFMAAQSRGGALALAAALSIVGLYRFGRRAILGILLIALCGMAVPNPLVHRFREAPAQEALAYTRFDIWENSFQRVLDRPWGVGIGTYKYSSFLYQFPINDAVVRYEKRAESAHNEYLQIAVELGVGGLVIFLMGVWRWGGEAVRFLRDKGTEEERAYVVGLGGGALVILFHAAVDSIFHEPALVLLLLLTGGLVLALQRLNGESRNPWWTIPFTPHPARTGMGLFGILLLLLLTVQPPIAWYSYEKGTHEAAQGRVDQAIRWYRYATLVEPGVTAYHDALALVHAQRYRQTGNIQWLLDAIDEMRICTELNSLDGRFPSRLGSLHRMLASASGQGERRDALIRQSERFFELAITRSPFMMVNYWELADIRLKDGRLKEAREYAKRAIRHEPNFLPARALLAEVAMRLGEARDAASELNTIQTIQKRYGGQRLNALERQYLEVTTDHLEREILSKAVS